MDLCRDCIEFAIAISKRLETWERQDSFWNAARLRRNSGSCRLCKMMSDYILGNVADPPPRLGKLVRLFHRAFKGFTSSHPLSCVRFSTEHISHFEILVWCDPGNNTFSYVLDAVVVTFHPGSPTALSGAVCIKPPLPSDSCSAAFAHVNSLIQECLQNHEKCKSTISNSLVDETHGPKLPTRVLYVGCTDNANVSLMETRGEQGNYCALSYCWGPTNEHNILTTAENINSHFDGIKFDKLPKTFQDAIVVTRKIGIRYLWIDSLCIIQGDKADWTAESARMSEVYQKAYLVIAASGAAHPGEGCFSNRRRCSNSVEVPYFSETGQIMGSIWFSMRIPEDESPIWGPLHKRGWALQEWMLARRMLHFMPAGISWKCRELELGERHPINMQLYPNWDCIIQRFSQCQLTYKEDRLVALEGLAMAFQEASGDRYNLGVFESQLPELLLWMTMEGVDRSEDLDYVPSWSWASKGGPKIFWSTHHILGGSIIDKAELATDDSGALRVQGVLRECKISDIEVGDLDKLLSGLFLFLDLDCRENLHRIEGLSTASEFMGIAAFDREYSGTVNILFLNMLDDEKVCLIDL